VRSGWRISCTVIRDAPRKDVRQGYMYNFGIARSTYYRRKQAFTDGGTRQVMELRIGHLCREHKFLNGYRKITALLRLEIGVDHKAVLRIMQKYGWQCCVKVKKRKQTGH